ncbi:MAG: hypothetical protein RQ885_08325 [Desulfurococcales archaeon]|jgi:transcription initiation factor TFIIB|nr:hypothetical protein [Desulfurococcales archaeon]
MSISGSELDYMERRALNNIYSAINELSEVLGVSEDIVTKAREIAVKCVEKGVQRGRSYRCVALSIIYAASRIVGKPLPIKQISLTAGIPFSDLKSCYNSLLRAMWKDLRDLRPPDPGDYLESIARRTGVNDAIISEAKKILDAVRGKIVFVGKDPTTYAAAAIYIASKKLRKPVSKTRVAIAAGVTEVSVRNRIRELAEKLGIELEEMIQKPRVSRRGLKKKTRSGTN